MNTHWLAAALALALVLALAGATSGQQPGQQDAEETRRVVGAIQQAAASAEHQEESYQRVYEAFTKLLQNVSNNSLGNARRLVSRLNQLVGVAQPIVAQPGELVPPPAKQVEREQQREKQQQQQQQQARPSTQANDGDDARTEQILNRLDRVNGHTDQHTLRQLQEDVNRLVDTLGESYLRNVRRVIERVNRTLGEPAALAGQAPPPPPPPRGAHHQSSDRFAENAEGQRVPGFPGWDELITAVDRMQKSLASFVRSSTKLITAGRR